MVSERAERRLTAIFAGDIAGYSRMMGADEEGTLARLNAHRREFLEPKIAQYRGRIVKRTGDGILIEFASAVDAARCAIEMQRGMGERNANVPPDRRIELRIGIHVGDIIVEEGDIFGDGVNIAARLEGIAEPGGVCISEDAYRQVRGKLDAAFEDSGEHQLKNIVQPVRAYRMRPVTASEHVLSSAPSPSLPLPDKPSIAVLAFQNMSGDLDQEYFGDGIAEDIITTLSKSRWLFVIARNSSFAYKGRAVDIKQIGRELGVRYVLEGSVRKAGNRVRITGQLIEAATGAHLWAERYDRDLTDIFAVQDEITRGVATAIEPAMAHAEQQRASRKAPDSLDAWEAYHRGLWHFSKQEFRENGQAKPFFQRAIDLDANFSPGYYGLALCHLWDGWVYASRSLEECVNVTRPLARRALALDDADPMAHFVSGFVFTLGGVVQGAGSEFERAVSLNPNHAWTMGLLGAQRLNDGRRDEALALLGDAMRMSPHDPLMWAWMLWTAQVHYHKHDYEKAFDVAERSIRSWPDKPHAYRWKAASLGQLGRIDEAREALHEAIEISPQVFAYYARTRPPWMSPADYAHQLEGLRKAGLTDA